MGGVEVEITEVHKSTDPADPHSIAIGLRVREVRDGASFSTRFLVLRDRDTGRLYGPPMVHGTGDGGQKYMAKEAVIVAGGSGKLRVSFGVGPETLLRDVRLYTMKEVGEQYPAEYILYLADEFGPWRFRR